MEENYSNDKALANANQQALQFGLKIVLNACMDHYIESGSKLSRDEYWKRRMKLTGIQSFDSYVQGLASGWIDAGLIGADAIASKVKSVLGL